MSRILSMNEHYIKTIDEKEFIDQLSSIVNYLKAKLNQIKKIKIKNSLTFLKK